MFTRIVDHVSSEPFDICKIREHWPSENSSEVQQSQIDRQISNPFGIYLRQAVSSIDDDVRTGRVAGCVGGEVQVGALELVGFTLATRSIDQLWDGRAMRKAWLTP